MTKKNTNGSHKFYRADTEKLEAAITSTAKYQTEIASAGGLSRDTLRKAVEGERVTKAKASGICKGLNLCGCSPKALLEIIFPLGED